MTELARTYYSLTKPGIIRGNLITAAGGFLLASKGNIDFWQLLATLGGIALVIAAACVFNNYIDRGIDKKMDRTKKRALATKAVSGPSALIYATLLGLAGFTILAIYTNVLTVTLGVIAFFLYVVVYGIGKRRSVYGTVIGSVPGALPPVAGYTAVTDNLDVAASILFFVLVFWQMPHFYAIAMRRFDDYKAAGLPVMPVKKGMWATKLEILIYIGIFTVTTSMLTALGYTGYTYLAVMLVLGFAWLLRGLRGVNTTDDKKWAKGMFLFSLLVIAGFSIMISVDTWLP